MENGKLGRFWDTVYQSQRPIACSEYRRPIAPIVAATGRNV